VGCLAAITVGSGWIVTAGHLTFWVTLVAHLGEFLVKRPVLEQTGGSMGHHLVQTLIYGFFHWRPIERRLDASPDDSRSTA
jgi:hypothetical protein